MTALVPSGRPTLTPLRRLVTIRSSNVDKVMGEGEETIRLCNYVDVYYNDRITGDIEFSQGSAKPQEIERFGLRAGDVIITKDSETPDDIAVPALVEPSAQGVVCGYHLAILRPIPTEVFGPYLFWCLCSKPVREAFGIEAQGITRYGLTLNGIKSVLVPAPDIDIQKAIAHFLDTAIGHIDQVIEKAGGREAAKAAAKKSLLALLLEKRAALITAAITGEMDVRAIANATRSGLGSSRCRLVVGAEIIHRHQGSSRFGRMKLQKQLYLAEAHIGISELQGSYRREAAGPLDRALMDEVERALNAEGLYRIAQPDGVGTAVTYVPLAKAGQHLAELKALLGPRSDALRSLISTLRDLGSREVEAVATLYAVWNDALIDGQQPDDSYVVDGVLTEWHAEKGEKFTKADLQHWLAWMKRNGVVPRGQGPHTSHTITRDLFS